MGRYTPGSRSSSKAASLPWKTGVAKENNGQLIDIERLRLEDKRLQVRLTHVSTEAVVLKNSRNWQEGMPFRRTISDHSTTCTRSNPDAGRFYGISTACQVMGISRAEYYQWTHHKVTVHE